MASDVFVPIAFNQLDMSRLKGVGGVPSAIPGYDFSNSSRLSGNSSANPSGPFVPYYPDGEVKLLALNYSAIGNYFLIHA